MPCLHFVLRNEESVVSGGSSFYQDEILDTMVNIIYPSLLETTPKGDESIETVNISWNVVGSTSWVPSMTCNKKDKGEIVVEIVVE
jgi:hypothetical protein